MTQQIGTLTLFDTDLRILQTAYREGATALHLVAADGEPWGTLTVNMPGTELAADELLVKTWGENEAMREPALHTGLFVDTGRRVTSGFVEAEVWRRIQAH